MTQFTEANMETAMCLWEAMLALCNGPQSGGPLTDWFEDQGTVEVRHTLISWVGECEAAWEADRAAGTELVPYDWEHCPAWLTRKMETVL